MAKARRRYFEISPGWAGSQVVGLKTEGSSLMPLTTTVCFEALEACFGEPVPSSGQFWFHKRPNAIPDLVHATGDAAVVTAAFRSVVEAMAPGEAEFRPFAMRWPDDEPVVGEWFLMNVLNQVECFDYERMKYPRPTTPTRGATGEIWSEEDRWWYARSFQAYTHRPVYIDPQAPGPLQIWRPFFRSHSLFCTGELVNALKKAGVKRLHAERLGTRDDPLKEYDWAALGVTPPGPQGPPLTPQQYLAIKRAEHVFAMQTWHRNNALAPLIKAGGIATALGVEPTPNRVSLPDAVIAAGLTGLSAHSDAQPQHTATIHGLLDAALADAPDPAAQLNLLITRLQSIVAAR
jgi:hypothetical protein